MMMTRKSAVSLTELIIAMSLALLVSGVLLFVYVTNVRNPEVGIEILDFLRKATILVEYIKMDIRSSLKDSDSVRVNSQGTELAIRTTQHDKTVTLNYKYDPNGHAVRRDTSSDSRTFGTDGKEGTVKSFAVRPVEKMPGFFRVDVVFERLAAIRAAGSSPTTQPSEGEKPRTYLQFHTLVNKRAPEDSDRDVLWNYFYAAE